MKYRVKYLIKSLYYTTCFHYLNGYNLDNYKLNKNEEIEIEVNSNENNFLYLVIIKNNKIYYGLSEDNLDRFLKDCGKTNKDYYIREKKLIKDVIIESIIE